MKKYINIPLLALIALFLLPILSHAQPTFSDDVKDAQTNLPVKFISISANLTNATQGKISWQVATEINVNDYQIEASNDGVLFIKKGTVPAIGNSAYSFIDALQFNGNNYYRVKAVDKSGAVTYSATVVVSATTITATVVNVYPNPVINHTLNVYLNSPINQTYSIKLIDNLGKVIVSRTVSYAGGAVMYTFDLPTNIAIGNYHLTINGQAQTLITKEIIIK